MGHTYYSLLFHCVFSTKDRWPQIDKEVQGDLWAYIGGIARTREVKALAVGGIDDHVHMLLSLSTVTPVANIVRQIKAGSSAWMHDERGRQDFAWQEGYGAFSIGRSQMNDTVAYILNQAEHHHKFDFKTEFIAFLTKHEIEYDPRYVWG